MNKSFAVLYIYDLLLKGVKFKTTDIEEACECSLRTAKRHMQTVKKYVENFHEGKTLRYVSGEKSYFIVDKVTK